MRDVRALFGKLRRLLLSRGRSTDDIDDLVQEAFLRLQSYCRDHSVQNTEAFLVRVVLNLSHEKARRSRPYHTLADESELLAVLDTASTPDEIYIEQQCLSRMRAGLERLTPRSREVFLMHRLDGKSYQQIAQELQISLSMVEKHIARASFFLREWMAGNE
jgi:RNA polymerase sigma factor (sigma-70 family)